MADLMPAGILYETSVISNSAQQRCSAFCWYESQVVNCGKFYYFISVTVIKIFFVFWLRRDSATVLVDFCINYFFCNFGVSFSRKTLYQCKVMLGRNKICLKYYFDEQSLHHYFIWYIFTSLDVANYFQESMQLETCISMIVDAI